MHRASNVFDQHLFIAWNECLFAFSFQVCHSNKKYDVNMKDIDYANDTNFCCTLQIQDVYITTYETCGQYWPYIHHYILVAIVIMQITMIGLFGLKSKPAASFATIPLLVLTLFFNEYCKARFLPTFYQFSVKVEKHFYLSGSDETTMFFLFLSFSKLILISSNTELVCLQDARDRDEFDEKTDLMEPNLQNAIEAYSPPCLRPLDLEEGESSSLEPLINSK